MHSFISWKANDIPLKIIVIILNNYLVLKRLEKEKKSHDANPESHKKSFNVFPMNSAFQLMIALFEMIK